MRKSSRIWTQIWFWVWLVAIAVVAGEGTARAYIDPGSGSQILQVLIAGLLGALYGVKVFWKRIVEFFQKCVKRPKR